MAACRAHAPVGLHGSPALCHAAGGAARVLSPAATSRPSLGSSLGPRLRPHPFCHTSAKPRLSFGDSLARRRLPPLSRGGASGGASRHAGPAAAAAAANRQRLVRRRGRLARLPPQGGDRRRRHQLRLLLPARAAQVPRCSRDAAERQPRHGREARGCDVLVSGACDLPRYRRMRAKGERWARWPLSRSPVSFHKFKEPPLAAAP